MQPKMYFGGSLKLCCQYGVFYFPTMSSLVVRFAKKYSCSRMSHLNLKPVIFVCWVELGPHWYSSEVGAQLSLGLRHLLEQ